MARRITVTVIPRSRISSVAGDPAGSDFVVRVKVAPVDGKANTEVIRALARHLGVSQQHLRIVSGYTSRKKYIEVVC